ncbi:lipoprotein [Photobacterium aquae]|uniref:Lipoprotein n=1 Tax=Photobacterium aquae TaxID=1195763 RepID=A0A0J1GTW6_9GAMM|nr:copper resistance protein NlpE [Photobacterium aquae]KLV03163.1 lipoprotein [Photobacterium aquae]
MKKTFIALVVAGFVLAGCDQQGANDPAAQSNDSQAVVETTVVEDGAGETVDLVVTETEQAEQPVVDGAHNAQNALDWNGTYTGILPCADCEGIKTELVLGQDGTFNLTEVYLGKKDGTFEHDGTFNWNAAGNTIALPGISDQPIQYFVGENQLFRLDREGNRVTGELADHYTLKKQ